MNQLLWIALLVLVPSTEGESLENVPCVGWESNAAALQDAKSNWDNPPCYQFSYKFLGHSVGLPVEVVREVEDGVALNAKEEDTYKTMEDFFDLIEQQCVAACPESGAHSCSVTYSTTTSGTTYPSFISIDVEKYMADEEHIYTIDNFLVDTDCSRRTPTNFTNSTFEPTPHVTTMVPTSSPSIDATEAPTSMKTSTVAPTSASPEMNMTTAPTLAPAVNDTVAPTGAPQINDTVSPTLAPAVNETEAPTVASLANETTAPTLAPFINETVAPTLAPGINDTFINETMTPTQAPGINDTTAPTLAPTINETTTPTPAPVFNETATPTMAPVVNDTAAPGAEMSETDEPTSTPVAGEKNETTDPTLAPVTPNPTTAPTTENVLTNTTEPTTEPAVRDTVPPTTSPSTDVPTVAPTSPPPPSVAIRSFSVKLSGDSDLDENLDKAALIRTLEQYLYNDMVQVFPTLAEVRLTEVPTAANRRRSLQEDGILEIQLAGVAIFTETPPEDAKVAAQQESALQDTQRVQDAIDANASNIGTSASVQDIQVFDDSSQTKMPTTTTAPTQAVPTAVPTSLVGNSGTKRRSPTMLSGVLLAMVLGTLQLN